MNKPMIWVVGILVFLTVITGLVPQTTMFLNPYQVSCTTEHYDQIKTIEEQAVERNDPELCAKIKLGGWLGCGPGGDTEFGLRQSCYTGVAVMTDNLDICRQQSSDRCFTEVAIAKSDASICDQAKDAANRYGCYHDIAIKTKNPALCEKLLPSMSKDDCLEKTR